jgi:hypothetical protein
MNETMKPDVKEWYKEISSKGGKARAKKLTPKQRRKIAKDAINARWERNRKKKLEAA